MKKPSDKLYYLLGQLQTRPSFMQRLVGSNDQLCSVLAEIAAWQEPAAIPYLIPLAFDADPYVTLAASNAIHQLLLVVSDEDLVCLDEQIRHWSFWTDTGRWSQMEARKVANAAMTVDVRGAMLGLIACHRDGRVRQEAIRLLGIAGDRKAIPFLLLRVNDWVPSVRQAAQDVIQKWLDEGPFDAFLPHLYLVFRLKECQRSDEENIIDTVVHRLVKPECEAFLLDLIVQGDRKLSRQVFSIVLSWGEPKPQIVLAGLKSDDVIIRIRATKAVPVTFTGQQLLTVLTRLRENPFAAVRNAALLMSLSHCPESAIEILEKALLDRSPSVREQAIFQLKKLDHYEVVLNYRKALQSNKHVAVAIMGLGETGDKSDVPLIRQCLCSQATSERKAAVFALSRLGGDEYLDDFLGCLKDDSPKVARAAAKWLGRRIHLLNMDEIALLCFHDDRLHVRLAALAILYECDTWKGMPYLIRAAANADHIVGLQARRYIERSYNRVFTKPSPDQEIRLYDALQSCTGHLDRDFLKMLKTMATRSWPLGWLRQ